MIADIVTFWALTALVYGCVLAALHNHNHNHTS